MLRVRCGLRGSIRQRMDFAGARSNASVLRVNQLSMVDTADAGLPPNLVASLRCLLQATQPPGSKSGEGALSLLAAFPNFSALTGRRQGCGRAPPERPRSIDRDG